MVVSVNLIGQELWKIWCLHFAVYGNNPLQRILDVKALCEIFDSNSC